MTSPQPTTVAGPGLAPDAGTLSRELSEFLIELSIALHKTAIYPDDHPLLDTAVAGVYRKLKQLLDERGALSLGVARHQLIIEGVATQTTNQLLRELASKLHRHQLGAVRFAPGVLVEEVSSFLRTVSVDASRSGKPLGLGSPEEINQWPHVQLFPLSYGQLELLEEDDLLEEAEDEEEGEDNDPTPPDPFGLSRRKGRLPAQAARTRAAQLWVGLARAALATVNTDDAPPTDPVIVAKAIDERESDVAYDQVVVGYLLQIAEELKAARGKESAALQRRISRLVGTLQPHTLRRLLEMGGDKAQRRRFVLDAAQGLTVDAVVDLVSAAAETSHETISHSMLRLLTKFASHAEKNENAPARKESALALREHVQNLITGWELPDPNPDGYRDALEGMARAAPMFSNVEAIAPCEPVRMLAMALEADFVGGPVWKAVDTLVDQNQLTDVIDHLERAKDSDAREAIWEYVASVDRLDAFLRAELPDPELTRRLVARLGARAVPTMLTLLDEEIEEPIARHVGDLLVEVGDDAAPMIVERLEKATPHRLRLYMDVLAELPTPPEGLDAMVYAQHADGSVRRAAVAIALKVPVLRDPVIRIGAADSDSGVLSVACAGAREFGTPILAVPALLKRYDDPKLSPEIRALIVYAVGAAGSSQTIEWLTDRATKRRWFGGRVLAPKSPEMIAALNELAALWKGHPKAVPVLALARSSGDAELYAAATPQSGQPQRQRRMTGTYAAISENP